MDAEQARPVEDRLKTLEQVVFHNLKVWEENDARARKENAERQSAHLALQQRNNKLYLHFNVWQTLGIWVIAIALVLLINRG